MQLAIKTPFPTSQILTAAILAFAAYLIVTAFYSGIRRERAYLSNNVRDKDDNFLVIWMLIAAFALRIVLSNWLVGNKTDIRCFSLWADRAATGGLSNFYGSGEFSDYPPGYISVLAVMGKLANLFGHSVYSAAETYDLVYVFFVKLPSIIADLASAYLVFRLARKKLRFEPAFVLMALVAFNPVIMYISSGWGQIDQILTILLACSILLLMSNRPIFAGVVYGLAILIKPQALMAGPLMAVAYFMYVFDDNFFALTDVKCTDKCSARIGKTVIAVAAACLLIVASALPYSTQELPWYKLIFEKYLGTATSYEYATVNAYNFYAMIGANWVKLDTVAFLGITYKQLGIAGMIISIGYSLALYIVGRKKNKGALVLSAAYLFAAVFTIGHYMHERYIIPTLLLLIIAYVIYSDWRLLALMVGYTFPVFLNCLASFYYCEYIPMQTTHEFWDLGLIKWCSILNVVMFVLFTVVCTSIMLRGKTKGDVFSDKPLECLNKQGQPQIRKSKI